MVSNTGTDNTYPCPSGTTCTAKTQADNTTLQFDPEILRAQVDLALANW